MPDARNRPATAQLAVTKRAVVASPRSGMAVTATNLPGTACRDEEGDEATASEDRERDG